VIELGHSLGLPPEPVPPVLVLTQVWRKKLEGHPPVQLFVLSKIYDRGGARVDHFLDDIMHDGGSRAKKLGRRVVILVERYG
jgi:hypothetical protein